ncbi:TPA: hypothetical protein HIA15_004919 [Escherichia coli]|jgi:hypothetical protein|uniref:anti-phage protein KwaA n=1 Tax=Escherichia coli TaxID=562 RepID=UPI0002A32D7B|nr:anti-phage protein KwaA [Escherichia coli]EFK2136138.1 hypothetical protein [Escherichia coli]EJZ1365832.1 hypothetical protein [Escherichia coli]ELD94241.1 hypothetical protein A1SA_05054 [Escherichia coli KTE51]MBC9492391.1 hypothetical protein [Escherichia coli]MBC9568634.1 hypothetical protein [Escherichia coli]
MKIRMYLLSMLFLFIPITIYFSGIDNVWSVLDKAMSSCSGADGKFQCVLDYSNSRLTFSVLRSVICGALILTCSYTYIWYRWVLKNLDSGAVSRKLKVVSCKKESGEYLSFLSTYIMPLVFTDLSKPSNVVNFLFVLIIVGFLHIKTKRIHCNPTLSLFNVSAYKITYSVVANGREKTQDGELIVLSKDLIKENDFIRVINHDDYLTFAKKIIEE